MRVIGTITINKKLKRYTTLAIIQPGLLTYKQKN